MESESLDSIRSDFDGETRKRKLETEKFSTRQGFAFNAAKSSACKKGKPNYAMTQVPVGQFGFRKKFGRTMYKDVHTIRLFPSEHLSHKDTDNQLSVCGSPKIIQNWYNELPPNVLHKFERTGLKCLIDGLSNGVADSALLLCLAEKWWDTTHTFHFEKMGEMTMTPTDFTAITGLRVGGKMLKFYKSIHKKKDELVKYFGSPIQKISARSVEIQCIREAYRGLFPKTEEEEDMLLRAFIIGVLGATIFATPNNRVHLWYLPMLKNVKQIKEYNWGGAGLAFLYQQMDDTSRCNTNTIGGLWKAWEVWAREYITPTNVITESASMSSIPFSICWKDTQPPSMEFGVLLQFYRIKLLDLRKEEVNWQPWGHFSILEKQLKESAHATKRRILLSGPYGAEWYLGDRVSIQSMGTDVFFVPNPPPKSMLVVQDLTIVTEDWALNGKPAMEFVQSKEPTSYDEYLTKYFKSFQSIESKIQKGDWSKTNQDDCNNQSIADIIPMPPWSLLLPSTVGGPNLICIPRDVGIDNLQIPPHIKHISIDTAKNLLSMIGGMQHVLIEELTNARQLLRDYTIIIQRLKHRLHVRNSSNCEEEDNGSEDRNYWPNNNAEQDDAYGNNDIGSTNDS